MSHFSDQAWFDFVRHLLPATKTIEMVRHLEEGCEECQRLRAFWQKLHAITNREWEYEPDDSDVQIAKAAYASELPVLLLPKNVHLAEVVFDSLQDPLPTGFRATTIPTRHVVFRAKDWTIALRLTQEQGHGICINGQVMQSLMQAAGGLRVTLSKEATSVERAQTNAVGEFCVRCQKDTHMRLYVHVSEREALEIRLANVG